MQLDNKRQLSLELRLFNLRETDSVYKNRQSKTACVYCSTGIEICNIKEIGLK